jgi:HAD superfamily hydrolase (TIGR01549 family)
MARPLNFSGRKYLIFDLDGTLIDSSAGVVTATNYALESTGEPIRSSEEIKRFIGYPLREMFDSFSNKSYKTFWKYFQEKAVTEIVATTVPIGNASDIIRELSGRGYRIGIGTTKIRIHIEKILDKLDWRPYVSAYVGADDVSRVKPDPEAFEKAMLMLGGNKDNTIVIGDTINDVLAARAIPLPVIAVQSIFGNVTELENSNPDLIIKKLDGLLSILK